MKQFDGSRRISAVPYCSAIEKLIPTSPKVVRQFDLKIPFPFKNEMMSSVTPPLASTLTIESVHGLKETVTVTASGLAPTTSNLATATVRTSTQPKATTATGRAPVGN